MKLLLFDIDGTLLQVNGGVHPAVSHAVSTVTGHSVSTDGVTFSGRTDPAIFRDVLRASGVSNPDPVLDEVIQTYVQRAQETIGPDDVDPLPGVHDLISLLAQREDVCLGLVTGNVEPMSTHKLDTVGLASHFPVGAFGSDHTDRNKLPELAMRRAAARTGRAFSPEQTIIIGDTPKDIHCARAAGAHAVVVCTGGSTRPELHPHAPDLLLESLATTTDIAERLVRL